MNFELHQFKGEEATYDIIKRRSVNQETYESLKPEREVKSETLKMDKVDYKKFFIILLSIVVTGLVVAVVSVTALVYAIFKELATDGAWTNWGAWGLCSMTCGVGLSTRTRTCTDPRPKLMGRYCDGDSEQVKICNNVPCSDGVWTNWGYRGSCSSTCGGGLRTRKRTCTYPSPSLLGRYCNDSSGQVKICNNIPCSDSAATKEVLFRARSIKNLAPVQGETLVFETTITSLGSGYDNTTGIFTVPVSGMFIFSVQLCLNNDWKFYFEIVADNLALIKGLNSGSYNGCYTSVAPVFLNAGRQVWIKSGREGGNILRETDSETNMFAGMLIHT